MTARTDDRPQVTMKLHDGRLGMGERMKGIDILRDHRADISLVRQLLDRPMRWIWLCLLHPRPPNKAPCPVSLARFMPCYEFMEVYRPIVLVRDVGAVFTSIVGQPGRYGDSCSRQQDRLGIPSHIDSSQAGRWRCLEKGRNSFDCSLNRTGRGWCDYGRRQSASKGDSDRRRRH